MRMSGKRKVPGAEVKGQSINADKKLLDDVRSERTDDEFFEMVVRK